MANDASLLGLTTGPGSDRRAAESDDRLTEALRQQAATSEILRVISQSQTDAQPVFDTISTAALQLCGATAANVVTFDGELIHVAAIASAESGGTDALSKHFASYPRRPSGDTANTRAVLTRSVVTIPDVLDDPGYAAGGTAVAAGYRSVLSVPLMRGERALGAITVARAEPGPFPDGQVALLQTFADQAVIAIENVRLFTELGARNRDLTEALEQQTATSEILRVISRSQTDVQPVFDTIAAAALKLCGGTSANVFTYDGELIHIAALVNLNPGYASALRAVFPRPANRDTGATRAILMRRVIEVPDVLADAEYAIGPHSVAGGFRSILAVPLLRAGNAVGAIAVGRADPGRFPRSLIALLETFADQAVIAIDNVRLFNELAIRNRDLTEALEQQTATSDILRVMSQSQTDVQPVFDAIASAALKLCNATSGLVFTFDGELIRLAAAANLDPDATDAWRRSFPRPPSRDTAITRAVLTCDVAAIADVLEDPEYMLGPMAAATGFRSALAVPLVRDGKPIGGVGVGRREPGSFPDKQIALLRTFADQAVIAIENVRLFTDLEARTTELSRSVQELRALSEVGQTVSSTLDLETVLSTIVSRATELARTDGGSIYEYDDARERFVLHTADRLPDELVDALRANPIAKGEGALGRMALAGEPVQIPDIVDTGAYQSRVRDVLVRLGYRSLLALPLICDNRLLGGLAVNRKTAGPFDAEVIELLETFATQSAIAIQNARLFRELESKSRQLEAASQHKSEFLANMSHELRTPLNAIIGFSEVLAERMFGDVNDKQAEYLHDILESGRHLLSLINDILDLSKIEAGRMELERADMDVADVVSHTLTLVRERAHRRGIALECHVDPTIGVISADERKIKQVLLNLLSNALKFTPEGGRIDVRGRMSDGVVEISVADTGVGIGPADHEAVFEEFRQVGASDKKAGGTGLGLAITRKFVELHGGRIWVTSQIGRGATFTFTLPVAKMEADAGARAVQA